MPARVDMVNTPPQLSRGVQFQSTAQQHPRSVEGLPQLTSDTLSFGHYRIQPMQRVLLRGNQEVPIGGRAFDILTTLIDNAGEIVSQREIIERVWPGLYVEEANLRVHIANLRKVLGDGEKQARYIQTVPRRGYCFIAAVQRLSAEQAESGAAPRAPPRALPGAPPRPLARMLGRDATVADLVAKLKEQRFVSVVGAGGVGKTTVALAVANTISEWFDGAMAFVDLGALTSGQLVPSTVAAAVGLAPQSNSVISGLVTFLRGQRILIILDNCEHVIDQVSQLAETVFLEAPGAYILATSREALRVEGEAVHILAPLDLPPLSNSTTAEQALCWPAVQLFMERAAASGYPSELSDEDAPIVAAICSRLDGLALAIELAAGRAATHGIRGTADLLTHRFRLLWQGRRNALPRQQTMQAILDWSHNLLSDDDKIVLVRLSVFVGGFSLEAAQQVVSDGHLSHLQVATSIESLLDKSLLTTRSGEKGVHYRPLEITRSYAAIRLEEVGDRDEVARRHALYCLEYLAGPEGCGAFADVPSKIGNLRSALEWSFADLAHSDIAISLAAHSVPVFRHYSRLVECAQWCERALDALCDTYRDTSTELALLEGYAVSLMYTRGHKDHVENAIGRALSVARQLGLPEDELRLLSWWHIYKLRIGDFRGGFEAAEQSAEVAKLVPHEGAQAAAEAMLGASYFAIGHQLKAAQHCAASARLLESPSAAAYVDTHGFGQRMWGLTVYSRALWLRGHPRQAEEIARRAIAEADAREHPLGLCIALIYSTLVSVWRGDNATADERIRRSLATASSNSLELFRILGLGVRGKVALRRGHLSSAIDDLRSSLSRLDEGKYLLLSTILLRSLAEALATDGNFDEALSLLERGFAQVEASGETSQLPDLLRTRGKILAESPDPDLTIAESDLLEAVRLSRAQYAPGLELRTALPLAQLWIGVGKATEARQLLSGALSNFAEDIDDADIRCARHLLNLSNAPK